MDVRRGLRDRLRTALQAVGVHYGDVFLEQAVDYVGMQSAAFLGGEHIGCRLVGPLAFSEPTAQSLDFIQSGLAALRDKLLRILERAFLAGDGDFHR